MPPTSTTLLSPPPLAVTTLRPAPPARLRGPRHRRRLALQFTLVLLWLAVVISATLAGLQLREWAWRETEPIRFRFDVANAMRIGHGVNDDAVALSRNRDFVKLLASGDFAGAAARVATDRERPRRRGGLQRVLNALSPPATAPVTTSMIPVANWRDTFTAYVSQYNRAFAEVVTSRQTDLAGAPVPDNAYFFDYPPGRLWLVTMWLREVRSDPDLVTPGDASRRTYSDAAIGPMRRVNEWHEWLAAAGIFMLVRRTLCRAGRSPPRATALATFAALLAWFNPALLLNAHGWPQWDCWVLPYAIWAFYFGVSDRWLMTGALIAIGAMFKGQVLIIAPLIVMWPLFRFDIDAVARLAAGFIFAAAACLSPWLIQTTPAIAWLAGVAVITAMLAATNSRIRWPGRSRPHSVAGEQADRAARSRAALWHDPAALWFFALVGIALAWIVAPFAVPGTPVSVATMLLLAGFAIGVPAIWRGRVLAMVLAMVGFGAFAAAARFDGSFAWLPVGFQTGRYPEMIMGRVANLPGVLAANYGWKIDSPVPFFGTTVEMRALLRGVQAVGLAILAIGLARATRRGRGALDANLLVALPAAWVLAYAVLPQMHERYLLWGAVTSAVLAARSVGGLLAYLFLTLTQVAMILLAMIDSKRMTDVAPWSDIHKLFRGLQPQLGYAVTLMACVLIVWALTRDERSRLPK